MKKYLLILFFTLFINASADSENINITLDRKDDATIVISWNILYPEYDSITLEILHDGKVETYDIPLKESSIEVCCYENEVTATINVVVTKVVQLSNEECSAESCISFEREKFQNQTIISAIPTTTTTTTKAQENSCLHIHASHSPAQPKPTPAQLSGVRLALARL